MIKFFSRIVPSIVVSLLFLNTSLSQTSIPDSLKNIIATTKTDTVKILALKDLAFYLSRNSPAEAEALCKQCLELSDKADYAQGIIKCNNIMGIISIYKPDYATAIEYFNISLKKAREVNDHMAIFKVYNNLGSLYINLSDYQNAARSFSQAMTIAEKLNDKKSIAQCCNNIAIIHQDNKNYEKAMEYNNRAIKICKELNDEMLLSQVYSNVSTIKFLQNNYQSAIDYCLKAIPLQMRADDLYGLGINFVNLGEYYFAFVQADSGDLKEKNMALDSSDFYYKRALAVALELKDEQRICNSKIGLGNISLYKKKYADARKNFNEALQLSKKTGIIETTMQVYSLLADVDMAIGNYKNALENFRIHKIYSDSIYTSENQRSINELEIKYQTEKNQKEIEILNRDKVLASIRSKILIGGILVLLLILLISYKALQIKKKDNKILTQKNEEIKRQREEIQKQANFLVDANHEITIQKEQIEKDHTKITDSISYAQYIQTAVMPSYEYINQFLPGSFILFMPRDIVSGDFYLVKNSGRKVFIIAADCTGHGVPGAFMSMLGIAILNELIQKHEKNGAAQILEALRSQVKSALQQTGRKGEQSEGMDIALCILDQETNLLNYAGAYSPLWLFRNAEPGQPSEFIEYKADRQPAGIYLKEKPFTDHVIQVKKGDTFYIFSDGFYSQFGGDHGDKMKSRRFQEIITEINNLPIDRQKAALEKHYEDWKGSENQIDDILVLGVKV
ncbi:MAG TPA: tetratricopeptide repeat protein [Bacteroidales bacterium]|nr:tetratricopeptide repeat protein [Bacteroidales bacterium]